MCPVSSGCGAQDFCRDRDTSLRSLGLKEFTALLFRRCPGLSPYAHMCSDILGRFAAFKQGVPVMGAVLLDPSLRKCLLVKGYAAHSAWGFPRGKVAKGEADASCAIREVDVLEEGCMPPCSSATTHRLIQSTACWMISAAA